MIYQEFVCSEGRDWKGNRQGSPSDSIIRRHAAGRWGKEERTLRLSRYACVAARLSVFRDDAGGQACQGRGALVIGAWASMAFPIISQV